MLTLATASFSQETIKMANIVELSGGGATAGANFKNGVELAVKEINAAGGILGKKIQTTTSDTQNADGVFVYSNEEESARILRELRKQGWTKPIMVEVKNGKQEVVATLPPLGAAAAPAAKK